MRRDQTNGSNLGFCGNKSHAQIGQEFTQAYLGVGQPPYTEWELASIHRRWTILGKQVASGSKIKGR
jgi:hypothetical protein